MSPCNHFGRAACAAAVCMLGSVASAQDANGLLQAMIPLEMLPVDPALATGGLWVRGPVWSEPRIALQPARAARAVVVEARNGDSESYVLTLLGAVERRPDGTPELDVEHDRRAWCELPTGNNPYGEMQCFQDTDGDGAFDVARQGVRGNVEPLSLNRVGEPNAIEPVAYRGALPEEIPLFQVGYESCRSQVGEAISLDSELRYATLVRRTDRRYVGASTAAGAPAACGNLAELLETQDNGDSVVRFGRFVVLLHQEGDEITTTLLEGIAPGTYLGNVRADRPLIDATDVAATAAAEAPRKPFLYFATPPTLESGDVSAGEHIVIAEVAHGITGTLAVAIPTGTRSKPNPLPVGTPLFGVPMSSNSEPESFDPTIVWCAPGLDGDRRISRCFVGVTVVTNFEPYVLQSLSVDSGSGGKTAPIVERGPVDFGAPLLLALRFDGVDRRNVVLSRSVAPADAPAWRELRLRRTVEGRGLLALGGALIEVTPSSDGTSATFGRLDEFRQDADAVPRDAAGLFQ